jgi:hypothetical protein
MSALATALLEQIVRATRDELLLIDSTTLPAHLRACKAVFAAF